MSDSTIHIIELQLDGRGKERRYELHFPEAKVGSYAAALAEEFGVEDYRLDGEDVTHVLPTDDNHTPGVPAEDCEICGPLLAEDDGEVA